MTRSNQTSSGAILAAEVGQIGCLVGVISVGIIGIGLGVGWLLDEQFGTGGLFKVLFMVGSFPITLYAIVRLSFFYINRAQARIAALEKEKEAKKANGEVDADIESH